MSTDPLLLGIVRDIQTDVKQISKDVNQLKLEHQEISMGFKGHVKEYESDKVRFNNAIQWQTKIDGTLDKKLEDTLAPYTDVVEAIKEDIKIINIDHKNIVEQYKEAKYLNKVSKVVWMTGGSVMGILATVIAWVIKNFDMVIK